MKKKFEECSCDECGKTVTIPEDHNCYRDEHPMKGWFTLGRYQLDRMNLGGLGMDTYLCSKDCMKKFIDKQP